MLGNELKFNITVDEIEYNVFRYTYSYGQVYHIWGPKFSRFMLDYKDGVWKDHLGSDLAEQLGKEIEAFLLTQKS